jgi:isoleucyl-tRNA synthetase
LPLESILKLETGGSVTVDGEEITLADVEIRRAPKGGNANLSVHQVVSIEVDPTVTPEQEREGLAREIMRKIQMARKTADFKLDDKITLEIACEGVLLDALNAHKEMITSETLTAKLNILPLVATPKGAHVDDSDIDGEKIKIGVQN